MRCLNVEEAVFNVSDNVVFSTSSSSFNPWAIRAVEAIVSLREGWSNHDTRSVTSLSPRSRSNALDALCVLAGLTLNDPLEVVTACLNSWYWAAEIFLWSPSSSLSSEMDLYLILSSGSKAAEKFTGEAYLVGESTDEDLVTGERDRVDSLVSSNPLALLTGVLAHLTGVLGRLSGVLGGVSDLLGGVSSLWTGTVDCAAGLAVHMDKKSINVAWLIAVGIDGKRGLLTPVKMDESCPADDVFRARVPWAAGPSNAKGWRRAGLATPAESSNWSAEPSVADCWLAGSATSSGPFITTGLSCLADQSPADPSYAGPSSAGPSLAGSSPARPSLAGPSSAGPSTTSDRSVTVAGPSTSAADSSYVIWPGRRRDHCYGSPLWWLGNGTAVLPVWRGMMNQTFQHSLVFSHDDDQAETCGQPTPSMKNWRWRQGPAITRRLAMMMSMRGRGWRPGVRRLGNTAGPWTTSRIRLSPGAGPARGHGSGPLTLSSSTVVSRSMISGGVLASVGPVRSSLTIPTSWSVAFWPVRSWAVPPHIRWKPQTSWVHGTFDPELVAVLARLDLDDPSLERLAGSWRTSSGACISTESSIVSRSWDFFAAFATAAILRLLSCSLASGSQSLQISQGESSVYKVSLWFSRHCWRR